MNDAINGAISSLHWKSKGNVYRWLAEASQPEPALRDTGASFIITLYRLDIEKVLAEEKAKAIDLVALGLNQRQQEAVEYVLEQGRITNREYRGLTGVSRRWATKEIREMVDLGILTVQGTGRAIHYVMMRD